MGMRVQELLPKMYDQVDVSPNRTSSTAAANRPFESPATRLPPQGAERAVWPDTGHSLLD